MYQHILLAVALQQWEEFSPHALAARKAASALVDGHVDSDPCHRG